MTKEITHYVSMLMFSADSKKVVLITKNKPTFLAGKLCPVGGHIEAGEEPNFAAAREFAEETGVETLPSDWVEYALCDSPSTKMHCFVAFDEKALDCHTTTDEPVSVEEVGDLLATVSDKPEIACSDLIALIGLAKQAGIRDGHACISYK
jgi:8-oxo-dGTP pyrophosphatase MutT (NUDIX family)